MIPGLLYQKTTRTPNASQKNDSGELSLKGFRVQGSGLAPRGGAPLILYETGFPYFNISLLAQ